MDALHDALNPWLGKPRWKQGEGRITFFYRIASEGAPSLPLRLKIEINTREHFSVFGFHTMPFAVASTWFEGECKITSYHLDELLGTKLRALHQRRKGRDLFDLHIALQHDGVDPARILESFHRYMAHGGLEITRAVFEKTFAGKLCNRQFAADIGLLLAPSSQWDMNAAAATVSTQLIERLPGAPWKGASA